MKLKPFWNIELLRAPADGAGGAVPGDGDPAPVPAEGADPAAGAPADPAQATPPAGEPAPAAPAEGPDFSWVSEDFRGEGGTVDMDRFREHYQDLIAEETRRNEAAANVPENGEYDFTAPDDLDLSAFNLPEGVGIELNTDDEAFKPLFGELGAFLKENNLPAEAGKQVAGLLKKYEAAKYSKAHEAATADYATLGPNDAARDARVQRVARALETRLPKAQADVLKGYATSAEGVKALEALVMAQGSHAPGAAPRQAEVDPLAARYPKSQQ